jgi:hypothetical protein
MRRDAKIANEPRVDPGDRTVADELDNAGAGGNRVSDGDRPGDFSPREHDDRGFVPPPDFIDGSSRRSYSDAQGRRTPNSGLERDCVVIARGDLWNDNAILDVEALRGHRARRVVNALREIQTISCDVRPVADDQDADGECADRKNEGQAASG